MWTTLTMFLLFAAARGRRLPVAPEGGLQIVPGVAVPIGVGPSRGERALFLYLGSNIR